ncbi:uncharacterized protein LOC126617622 isoform X3 [Malus sylvestris]|uniref:uncharacterized protein LOC126617622 isoform X3 n=1 Tax=Malus sylvestris TaxID=3752 RepID=UPI0021ACA7A8|nr:uncharacterized protein LOC126617622 isoform X3 [Malus sylvestris]
MLGILRQKVGAGSSSAMTLGQRIRPATSAMRGFASSAKEVLLGDVGAGKSSLVLRFVKEQFVEFQVHRPYKAITCILVHFGAVLGLEWIAHAWSKVDGRN